MFRVSAKAVSNVDRVARAAERATFRNLGHASARISKDAKASIVTDDDPAAVGQPPHTKNAAGHNLRGAIRYDANKEDAVIGPIASFVGEAGRAHELGDEHRGQDFPERPFMLPALEKNLDRFAKDWKGSITE